MSAPRVSVVIATHDRSALVAEAIASVLAQSFTDLEVVVCDDGSRDDTAERVRAFGPPVRYVRIEHSGRPGVTRNRGVEAARGELLAFLDDDDLWAPEKLARQVERLDREPALDLVYTDRRVLYEDGSRLDWVASPEPGRDGLLLDQVLAGWFPCATTIMVRREVLARTGGWDESLLTGSGIPLWLRLGRLARVARVPEPLAILRRQHGSISNRSPWVGLSNHIAVFERELGAEDLTAAQRLRCRRTLAHLEAQLALALAGQRDRAGAGRAALRGIARFPLSRSAWAGAARLWLGRA